MNFYMRLRRAIPSTAAILYVRQNKFMAVSPDSFSFLTSPIVKGKGRLRQTSQRVGLTKIWKGMVNVTISSTYHNGLLKASPSPEPLQ